MFEAVGDFMNRGGEILNFIFVVTLVSMALLALFIYFGVHQARGKRSEHDESNPLQR